MVTPTIEAFQAELARKTALIAKLQEENFKLEKRLAFGDTKDSERSSSHSNYAQPSPAHQLQALSGEIEGLKNHIAQLQGKMEFNHDGLANMAALQSENAALRERNKQLEAELASMKIMLAAVQANPSLNQNFSAGATAINNIYNINIPSHFLDTTSTPAASAVAAAPSPRQMTLPSRPIEVKPPRYSTMCTREENGTCQRTSCRYFHTDQMEKFGHLRESLPKGGSEWYAAKQGSEEGA